MTTIRVQTRGSATALALALALALVLALACASRRPQATGEKADSDQTTEVKAPTRNVCEGAGPALLAASLTVEWQREETVQRLNVAGDGTVRLRGTLVARLVGACVLDGRGDILRLVDARNVVSDGRRQQVGTFRHSTDLREASGGTVRVGEVLASSDGAVTAVTDDGAVYLARRGESAFSLPASVEGAIARGRRVALLLLDLGSQLAGAAPRRQAGAHSP